MDKIKNNLLLKVSLKSSPRRNDIGINVKWNLDIGDYYFTVGDNYLPSTMIISTAPGLFVNSNNREIMMPPDSVLVLNNGTSYNLSFRSESNSFFLFVFFSKSFVNDFAESANFDATEWFRKKESLFYEKVHSGEVNFTNSVKNILENFDIYDNSGVDESEIFYSMISKMFDCRQSVEMEIESLGFRKRATREEIYRRLNKAYEFLFYSPCRNISIGEIARESALSKYYLIRLFKKVYNVTPIEMHSRLRINKAKELLLDPLKHITDICSEVGYSSIGTFSLLFKKQTGLSPSNYRKYLINKQ